MIATAGLFGEVERRWISLVVVAIGNGFEGWVLVEETRFGGAFRLEEGRALSQEALRGTIVGGRGLCAVWAVLGRPGRSWSDWRRHCELPGGADARRGEGPRRGSESKQVQECGACPTWERDQLDLVDVVDSLVLSRFALSSSWHLRGIDQTPFLPTFI